MKYPLFKFIVLAFFVLMVSVLGKPTPVNAMCVETGYGFPSRISSFTVGLSGDTLNVSGSFTSGGECIGGRMYREGIPSVNISGTGLSAYGPQCLSINCTFASAINVSGLSNGTYTAVFYVDDSWGNAIPRTANFTVARPAPTVSLTASPNPVAYGGRSTLTWNSTNASSCTAGGPWSNSGTLSGSGWTDPLYGNTTFTFQCTGPSGTTPLQSVTVTVIPRPKPTATLSASPLTVAYGSHSTLTWSSTNADSCIAGGPWSNSGTTAGSGWTNPLYADTTFTLQCTNTTGTSYPLQSVTVTVPQPINGVCGSANGVTYTYGATNYTPYAQCSSGSPSSTAFPSAGSSVSWTCSGTNGGASSGSCSASQSAPVPSVSVSANPTSVPLGGSSTVTWSSSNTTSCTASGTDSAWLGAKALSGSQVFNNLTAGLHTYTLGCSGPGGSGSGSATVNVASFACGNGTCETGENLLTCPTDCKVKVQQF